MSRETEIEALRTRLAELEAERQTEQASLNAKVAQQRKDIVSQINTLIKALEGLPLLPLLRQVDACIDVGDKQIVYDGFAWSFPSKDGSDWYSSSSDC